MQTSSTGNNAHGITRIYAFDKIVIGYCLLMVGLLLVIGRPLTEYYGELLFYASMAAVAALVAHFVSENNNRVNMAVRLLYPGLMFTFFYRETGGTIFLLFDSFYDWQLTAFEKSIFGVYPTIVIDRHLLNVWLNEIFSFCYFAYYFMIPVFMLSVFVRRDYEILRRFLAAVCLTFFVSYLLFFLYPIEGPRWHFAAAYLNSIDGPVFRQLTEFVIDTGAVRGGCMPSSHFAVALVILMFCYRYYRKVAWPLTPIVIGLAIGTIWGRFHYVSDVLVGGLIGLTTVLLVWKYHPILPSRNYRISKEKEPAPENVP